MTLKFTPRVGGRMATVYIRSDIDFEHFIALVVMYAARDELPKKLATKSYLETAVREGLAERGARQPDSWSDYDDIEILTSWATASILNHYPKLRP